MLMDPLFNLFWYLFGVSFLKKRTMKALIIFIEITLKWEWERERKIDRDAGLLFKKSIMPMVTLQLWKYENGEIGWFTVIHKA